MTKRVVLAGLFHETNTFLPGLTGAAEFTMRRGAAVLEAGGDSSPLGGALEVARDASWTVLPVIDLRATPSATVADDVVETFWQTFQATVARERSGGLDGIFLVLHGAMVSASIADVEGEMLRRIRSLEGCADIPICGVVDLHANVSPVMAHHATALVAYRENPHSDARDAAMRAAALLDRVMRSGERPRTVLEQPQVLWPPTGTGTATEPMRALEEQARAIEASYPDILAVNVFAGFSFADVREAGVSFTAVTLGDPDVARRLLQGLSAYAHEHRQAGNVTGRSLDDVMESLRHERGGPVALVEPADNIGAGAPGDLTNVLRSLLAHNVRNAGVIIDDARAVQIVVARKPGTRLQFAIGGASGVIGADALPLDVEVVSTSDGQFTLEDPQSHLASITGNHVDMGPCAVVRTHGDTHILLTSRKTPPFDLGQWRSQGIDPRRLSAIAIKAAVAHRRAYDPITTASYLIDSPGPCANDLRSLPFKRVRRPIYPLDAL